MHDREASPIDRFESLLHAGDYKLGIWGTGFIGFSTMANFANKGIKTIGYDIDEERVASINRGEIPIDNLEYWLGFETQPLVKDGLMEATTAKEDLITEEVPVHFLAIPTEKDGVPWEGALQETIDNIAKFENVDTDEPILIIVESTLTPGMSESVIFPILEDSGLEAGEDVLVGVAPRRDWFISPDKNLRDLPRVYGGQNDKTTEFMDRVLGIVCENLVPAPDHQHAEMVKSIENAYRHVGITLANQLARAFPDIDMREILQLVGTKWNIPTYYPSIGTGGYCIPLSSQYVLHGTDHEEELSILNETIESDKEQPLVVADAIAESGVESIALLGLAYKGDVKVDILSPTRPIVDRLQEHGVEVGVNDPYYGESYIESETNADAIAFPDGLRGHDAVLIVADHRKYRYTPDKEVIETLDSCQLVIDNHRIWEDLNLEDIGVEYTYTGGPGWLEPTVGERTATPD